MFGKRQYGTKPAHQGRFRESLAARRLQARTRVFSQTYFAERYLSTKCLLQFCPLGIQCLQANTLSPVQTDRFGHQ